MSNVSSDVSPSHSAGVARENRWLAVIAIAILSGTALRVAGAANDLWLDEIWSIHLAALAQSPLDVIFHTKIDNNHWLNTLWLYLTLAQTSPLILRAPAIAMGSGSIALMAVIARSRGRTDAIFAALLGALSYPLIHFSSEARGYAGAVFFGLLAVWLADGYLRRQQLRWAILFWISCLTGCMWHPTFIFAYAGIAIWTAARLWRSSAAAQGLPRFAMLQLVPLALLAAFYVACIKDIGVGGGPPSSRLLVLGETVAMSLGASGSKGVLTVVALGALVGSLASALLLHRERSDLVILYGSILLSGPLMSVLWQQTEFLHVRYFLVCVPFLLLLISHLLATLFAQGRAGRALAIILLAGFCIGSTQQTVRLLEYGRGMYRQAILDIAGQNPGSDIEIGSDHDFRNRMTLDYHSRVLGGQKRIVYVTVDSNTVPEWLLVHRLEIDAPVPDTHGAPYQFVKAYPHGGLSGWTWMVFRRIDQR